MAASDGCYEPTAKFQYGLADALNVRHKYMFRIVPLKRCLERMVKKNYYQENRSLGAGFDFDLAFQGVSNYMKPSIDKIKAQN